MNRNYREDPIYKFLKEQHRIDNRYRHKIEMLNYKLGYIEKEYLDKGVAYELDEIYEEGEERNSRYLGKECVSKTLYGKKDKYFVVLFVDYYDNGETSYSTWKFEHRLTKDEVYLYSMGCALSSMLEEPLKNRFKDLDVEDFLYGQICEYLKNNRSTTSIANA